MVIRKVLWALVLVGLLASLWGAKRRFSVEQRNRRVEIAVDFNEVRTIAVAEGTTTDAVLTKLHDAGATSVLLSEDTLASLETSRKIEVVSTARKDTSFIAAHQGAFRRVLDNIQHRTNLTVDIPAGFETLSPEDASLNINRSFNQIEGFGAGLDPDALSAIHDAHLTPVARVLNSDNISADGIRWTLESLHRDGVRTVIFLGDSVLGYRGRLDETASALSLSTVNFGAVEFTKQFGDAALMKLAADRVVRVHTITAAEMGTSIPSENIQRFRLAARERNIRLLFVRLFLDDASPVESATTYIGKLSRAIQSASFTLGDAGPFHALSTPIWLRGLVGVGVGAGLLLLLDSIVGLLGPTGGARWATVVQMIATLAALGMVGLAILPSAIGPKLAALAAACVFPTLGACVRDLAAPRAGGNLPLWRETLERFAFWCALTFVGVAALVALLADRIFLVKADSFLGVKATLVVPLLVTAAVYALNLRASSLPAFAARLKALWNEAQQIASQPVLIWQIVFGAMALAALMLLVMRSGNDPGIGVSETELKVRALLDRFLYVRPRFKDVFGHPLALLGLWLALRGKRKIASGLIIAAMVAQTSMLDAFCHLHTPLLIAAARDVLALLIGALFGLAAIWLWKTVEQRMAQRPDAKRTPMGTL